MATIRPVYPFDANEDAKKLRKAMKGFGCDESVIIEILCARSADQREAIVSAYKQLHGKNLIEDLKSELSGNFEKVIVGLMTPLDEYLANQVKKAIKGMGTDEDALIEILATRSNAEIQAIKAAFTRLFKEDMEAEVADDVSGYVKKVLVALMNAKRPEHTGVKGDVARKEAQELLNAGVASWGTDEETFIAIFCGNSREQLRATVDEYRNLAGHGILEAIEAEMSGDLKKTMMALAKSLYNTPLYFAERLHKAMAGLGTDDNTLIRIIVSRCEIDLVYIRDEYARIYEKSLESDIKDDTSGHYKHALVKLATGHVSRTKYY